MAENASSSDDRDDLELDASDFDDELGRRIRAANPLPVPSNLGRTERAQQVLDGILASPASHRARRRPRLPALLAASVAAVALVVAATVIFPLTGDRAMAQTPEPLRIVPVDESTDEVLSDSRQLLLTSEGPPEERRESTSIGWYARIDGDSLSLDRRPIEPQLTRVVWHDDLSGSIRALAARPYWADQPGHAVSPDDAPSEGTLLYEFDFAAGEFDTPLHVIGGSTAEDMAAALRAYGMEDPADAAAVFSATTMLLTHWTPTNLQQAALLQLLAQVRGIEIAGVTQDRLGREAFVFAATSHDGDFEHLLLVSTKTGRIIGYENIRATRIGGIPAGTVLAYTLWEVE